jgi:2-oxoglutarate ferredoxin oxidoreductase subunit beta
VTQHDGSSLQLRKLTADYDPTDKLAAMTHLQERQAAGEIVTGLLYLDPNGEDLHDRLQTVRTPLNALNESELCPGRIGLGKINASLR